MCITTYRHLPSTKLHRVCRRRWARKRSSTINDPNDWNFRSFDEAVICILIYKMKHDITIIGGGIIGSMLCRHLAALHPHKRIALLEKENEVYSFSHIDSSECIPPQEIVLSCMLVCTMLRIPSRPRYAAMDALSSPNSARITNYP